MDANFKQPGEPLFLQVPERNTGDNFLRTVQQHHVQLSVMADVKANIIITVSSIVLTLTINKLTDPALRVSAITLIVFTTVALLMAILAVLPKYRPLRLAGGKIPPDFNLLFFGHFAELSREQFLNELARSMPPNGNIYEMMGKDIYGLGYYLAHFKYRYLRLAYMSFLAGFLLASAEQMWRLVAG